MRARYFGSKAAAASAVGNSSAEMLKGSPAAPGIIVMM
jgi:hypothetical protein